MFEILQDDSSANQIPHSLGFVGTAVCFAAASAAAGLVSDLPGLTCEVFVLFVMAAEVSE